MDLEKQLGESLKDQVWRRITRRLDRYGDWSLCNKVEKSALCQAIPPLGARLVGSLSALSMLLRETLE